MFEIKISSDPSIPTGFTGEALSYSIVDAERNIILEVSSEDYFNGLSVLENIVSILNRLQELGYFNGKS